MKKITRFIYWVFYITYALLIAAPLVMIIIAVDEIKNKFLKEN